MAYNKPIFEMYWYTEDDWSWLKHVVSVKIIGHVMWFRYTLKPFKSGGNETGRMWSESLQPSMSSPKKTLSEYNLMRPIANWNELKFKYLMGILRLGSKKVWLHH